MKLAVVVGSFPQKSQTFIVRQALALDALVITNNYVLENNQYFSLGDLNVVNVSSSPGFIGKWLNRVYKRIYSIVLKTPKYKWSALELKRAKSALIEHQITGVLAAFGTHGVSILPVCQELKIKLVVQFLGFDASTFLSYKRYINELQGIFSYSSNIVVLSDWMVDDFVRIGCDRLKIKKINIGVPLDDLPLIEMDFCKTTNFIAMGRFVEKKAPLMTIKAFEICYQKDSNIHLYFIGDGPLLEKSKLYVKMNNLAENISFLGYQPQNYVKELVSKCHVFLQHSVKAANGDTEGWPVAIAEAACFGLPIISTKHAGILDQVVHGETGFLVNEYDYISMGESMLVLSNDRAKAKKMGLASRKHIEDTGDISIQCEKIVNLFFD
jgi:colanic acid/amylovoran biosynthesis glycosyltransferase